jgi:hypothetical protein
MNGWILVVGAVLVAVTMFGSQLWAAVKKLWPAAGASATADKAVDTALAFIDEASFLAALGPAWLLAKKRGDTMILDLLRQARVQAATWDDVASDTVVVSATVGTTTEK